MIRWYFTWLQRFIGLGVAFGLLHRKEWARKLIILMGFFLMFGTFWKHPYVVMFHSAQDAERLYHTVERFGVSFTSMVFPGLIFNYCCDIICGACLVFYFSRPAIKAFFQFKA